MEKKTALLNLIEERLDTLHYNVLQKSGITEPEVRYFEGRIESYEDIYFMLGGTAYEYKESR